MVCYLTNFLQDHYNDIADIIQISTRHLTRSPQNKFLTVSVQKKNGIRRNHMGYRVTNRRHDARKNSNGTEPQKKRWSPNR